MIVNKGVTAQVPVLVWSTTLVCGIIIIIICIGFLFSVVLWLWISNRHGGADHHDREEEVRLVGAIALASPSGHSGRGVFNIMERQDRWHYVKAFLFRYSYFRKHR